MKRPLRCLAFATMTVLLLFSSASAQQVTGAASGIFVSPIGPSGMVVTGVGTNSFTWGTPDTTPNPNNLTFTGQTFIAASGVPFVVGTTLDYYNGSIVPGTHADFVDLQISLAFTDTAGISENFQYSLELIGTLNTDDPVASADYVKLPTTFAPRVFNSGGLEYTLQILGFAVPAQSGFDFIDEFFVFENASASAALVASVTIVPEPISLLGLAGGLAGLAGLRLPVLLKSHRNRA